MDANPGVNENHQLPVWAPRVSRSLVYQLYQLDAQGLYDAELIDEVGYGLYSRCLSFIEATDATTGRVHCPQCREIIRHKMDKSVMLYCSCGWSLAWADYFATIQNKQLSGAEPVIELFQNYIDHFPAAQSLPEKMLLIDQLLHGFHWHARFGYTRPVAVNLLEGRLADVIRFLDRLSYGPESTAGLQENYQEWHTKGSYVRHWALKDSAS